MRIVITSNYKIGSETGTAYVTEELCKYLSKKHTVLYICCGDKYKVTEITKKFKVITIPSIEINKFALPLISPGVFIKIFKYLDKFKPIIVHAQNPLLISNMVQTWSQLNNVPLVVTFHHIPTQAIEHLVPKFTKNIITKLVQELYKQLSLKTFLQKTDGVIALNNFVMKSVKKINKKVQVKIINNGLDLEEFQSIVLRTKLKKRVNFIFFGSYIQRKNQETLIEVFSRLPENYILKCYGNIESGEKYYTNLVGLKNKLKTKNVLLRDFIDKKDLIKAFKNSDFFISASLKEAQSLAVIQSLASGKPVIGLENETIKELINESNGLIIPRRTTAAGFAKQVIKFVKSINYKEVSLNARKSSEIFSINKVILKIENFYKSVSQTYAKNGRGNISQNYNKIFKSIISQK